VRRKRACWSLVFGLGLFLLGQAAFVLSLETTRHDLRDPEFGQLLAVLRRATSDGRPLVLALGTSRTANGLVPSEVSADDLGGHRLFNFGLTGADPVERLLVYERLRREGVHASVLLAEVLPAHLTRCEGPGLVRLPGRLTAADMRELDALTPAPWRDWAADRADAWHAHRFALVSRHAPGWLPWSSRLDYLWLRDDPGGWLPDRRVLSEADRERGRARARREYAPALEQFAVASVQDRATRELVRRSQADGTRVVLYLMPEGPSYRGMSPPAARERLAAWLAGMRSEFGVGLIDARDWLPEDAFVDGHHLLAPGAREFSRRLGPALRPHLTGAVE
jgi:hypothetical protein